LVLWKIRELGADLPRDLRSEASLARSEPIVWFGRLPLLSSTRPRHLSNSRIHPLAKGGGVLAAAPGLRSQSLVGKCHFGMQFGKFKASFGLRQRLFRAELLDHDANEINDLCEVRQCIFKKCSISGNRHTRLLLRRFGHPVAQVYLIPPMPPRR